MEEKGRFYGVRLKGHLVTWYLFSTPGGVGEDNTKIPDDVLRRLGQGRFRQPKAQDDPEDDPDESSGSRPRAPPLKRKGQATLAFFSDIRKARQSLRATPAHPGRTFLSLQRMSGQLFGERESFPRRGYFTTPVIEYASI